MSPHRSGIFLNLITYRRTILEFSFKILSSFDDIPRALKTHNDVNSCLLNWTNSCAVRLRNKHVVVSPICETKICLQSIQPGAKLGFHLRISGYAPRIKTSPMTIHIFFQAEKSTRLTDFGFESFQAEKSPRLTDLEFQRNTGMLCTIRRN